MPFWVILILAANALLFLLIPVFVNNALDGVSWFFRGKTLSAELGELEDAQRKSQDDLKTILREEQERTGKVNWTKAKCKRCGDVVKFKTLDVLEQDRFNKDRDGLDKWVKCTSCGAMIDLN